MEGVRVRAWLRDGSGHGWGWGSGDGLGGGCGSGCGWGWGLGDGLGGGRGSGYGSGSGWGGGWGDGLGWGGGWGDGLGWGGDDGNNLLEINGQTVYKVDSTPTIFTAIHGNAAKAYILQSDLTLSPCWVVKGSGFFAHGDTLREAQSALTDKLFDDMPEADRIAEFIKTHPEREKAYPNQDLFDWHHKLTGSCLAGRNAFVKDNGLTLDGETTVAEFIKLTRDSFGSETIRALADAWAEA